MRSSSEWPKDAVVSFLSDILEPVPPPVGVLIEPESMRGDLESSAEKRASLAEEAGRSPRSAGFKYHQGAGAGGVGAEPEQSPTLTADWHNPAVYPIDQPITMADLNANTAIGYDMVGTLKVGGDAPSVCCRERAGGDKGALVSEAVRRLTPRECERLQGFPSDWTKIPYRGKSLDECPDGPRYKAIGNSMAVPVMRWIFKRIEAYAAGVSTQEVVE
nr:MAG TPA: Cytosine specific methyltransferase [Caudoviricetes sp.]